MVMKPSSPRVLYELDLEDISDRSYDKMRLEGKLIVYRTKSTVRESYGAIITYKYRRSGSKYRKVFGPFADYVSAIAKALNYWYNG